MIYMSRSTDIAADIARFDYPFFESSFHHAYISQTRCTAHLAETCDTDGKHYPLLSAIGTSAKLARFKLLELKCSRSSS